MANIMDYMDWRGDLSFEADEFNEVDNLILAQLAYVDFEGIVTAEENAPAVPLKEASGQFWEKNDKDEILARVSMTKSAPFVMEKMAETKRFSDVKLRCYVNEIRDEEQFQFSAVCVELPDDSLYVAFRGTDNTITGWREDFNMGYLSETPGQLRAVEYLNRAVTDKKQRVRVGGHSKGGNFAVYASVKCDPQIQNQILNVYSNDGPGFRSDMVESTEYQRMLPKLHTILPESSIVGMLLEHQESFEVVKSSNSGIQQHDAMSWEVLGRSFVHVDQVAAQSLLLDETFSALSLAERTAVQQRILTEIKGRMLEDIVLLETKLANPKKQVFVLQFPVGEFDMVVFDPEVGSCRIFEIKHSKEAVPQQYRHLIDKQKCAQTEHRYGPITEKFVLYRGGSQEIDGIQYQNVEEYLRSFA